VKYLITGGAGFIGSHLADALLARGDQVVALDNFSTGSRANVAHLAAHPGFRLVEADVRHFPTLEPLVAGCDRVVHLAAAVGVKLIMDKPVETILVNVRGTETVLEACTRHRRLVLVASTSEVYGKALEGAQTDVLEEEGDWVLGATSKRRWAYGCSKALDEFLSLAYHAEYGLEVVIVRFFNTVGPRQTGEYGMVIPRFVRMALAGQPIEVHGDGAQSRCFNHVSDAVASVLRLLENPAAVGAVVNVGNDEEVTIRELAERVVKAAKSRSRVELVPYEKAYAAGFEDMRRRVPSLKRLEALTGKPPRHSLDDILRDVIQHERSTSP